MCLPTTEVTVVNRNTTAHNTSVLEFIMSGNDEPNTERIKTSQIKTSI